MNIVARRKIWYALSLALLVPGIISLFVNGLRLGIDFRGGSALEVEGIVSQSQAETLAEGIGLKEITVKSVGDGRSQIRYRDDSASALAETNHQRYKAKLGETGFEEVSFDNVGPTVSRDITRNALFSIFFVSLAIVMFLAFAFRNVPPPVTSLSFGITAIITLLHDALFLLGTFSLLGAVFGVEIDAMFVTAVLTTIGYSVHDTIVVFDRIRENLRRGREDFATTVNNSIMETFVRSLNNSLTVLLVLLALFLFGGQTIRYFVLALLLGVAVGTYSSIFTAAPLLVDWNIRNAKKNSKR